MKVKDVIVSALNILGRAELASALADGRGLNAEENETVNTLLYCFNAVEDELARKYIPLSEEEKLTSKSGEYYYAAFTHAPVKIKKVTAGGERADYELLAQYMRVNRPEITVEYDYAPSRKKLDGYSDFEYCASEHLLALGAAAEYCLINGEAEAAGLWEGRYRKAIEAAQKKLPYGGSVPPRRWV